MRFFVKVAASTIGTFCTSASAFWFFDEKRRSGIVFAVTAVETPPESSNLQTKTYSTPIRSSEEWNWNWDGRHHEATKSRVVRHVYLIRHGQYHMRTRDEGEKQLTDLGNEQAFWTGKALAEWKISFTRLVQSGLIRAIQTATIINQHLGFKNVEQDVDLNEGFPFLPEPAGRYVVDVEKGRIQMETERMERAFRRYFHRPLSDQTEDSHELIVCHANVIRYFTCRALQIPADAWLRLNLFHCSITHLVFTSDGRVSCFGLGDVGHIPQERRSLRRPKRPKTPPDEQSN